MNADPAGHRLPTDAGRGVRAVFPRAGGRTAVAGRVAIQGTPGPRTHGSWQISHMLSERSRKGQSDRRKPNPGPRSRGEQRSR